jgi:hypothetical protein
MGVVFRIGNFLNSSGPDRLRNGSWDDYALRCGAGVDTTWRRRGVGASLVSNGQVERLPAHFGRRSPERYHCYRDLELSRVWRSCDYTGDWNITDNSWHLSVGSILRHAVSQLGLVTCKRNLNSHIGFYAAEEFIKHQPLVPCSRYWN